MKIIKNTNSLYFKSLLLIILLFTYSFSLFSASKQMEQLDRGVVAVKSSNGVFISWRYLGTDDENISFNIYRDGTKINDSPISDRTNYVDKSGSTSSKYIVKSVINGTETSASNAVEVWEQQYKTINLQRPADGSNASGNYTYTPNDMSVGDVDGDGQYELFVKWDPSNAKDNSQSGYTGNVYIDCYQLNGTFLWRIDLGVNIRAGAHYTQFQVYDYDGDGKAEMVCKTAPGTKDGKGKYVLLNNDNPYADYRNSNGYVLDGPEYLTIFRGETGEEIHTIEYNPGRGNVSNKSTWGDNYGNRCDRFLACTAYLDGVHPSVVMCRGYYTQSNLVAYDFIDDKLVQRWEHKSKTDGAGAYGEGFHNLSVADIDNDGFDEIIYGSACIDHDGSLKHRTGYGHGDAMHVSDLDPDRDGLEGWFVHEDKNSAYGFELRDLSTGRVIFGERTNDDNGRGLSADIDASHRGFECWSSRGAGTYDCKGNVISKNKPSINFRIYWDGDLQDELLDGTTISKWTGNGTSNLITLQGSSINGTKNNPCLSADLFGDWREEVITYNADNPSQIYIYTTIIESNYRLFTPMHDAVYRCGVAWQNTSYNQPPHLGFYIGDGVDHIKQPDIYVVGESPLVKDPSTTNKWIAYITDPTIANYNNDIVLLPALKGMENIDVIEINARRTNIDFSLFDMIIISEVAASNSPIMAKIKGINLPMLNMKVHVYKTSDATWSWASTGYGDNATATTLVVADNMKEHPIFKGIQLENNELDLLSGVNSKGYTYMNPANFNSSSGEINTIATIKGENNQVCILEAKAGSNISNTNITQNYLQIGINGSSFANITEDGVRLIQNACHYLLGITEEETSTYDTEEKVVRNIYVVDRTLYIRSERAGTTTLFNEMGQAIATIRLNEGINTVDGLAQGIYIINGEKVIVR